MARHLYHRYIAPRLVEALEDSPVVLIHGPRQCGKTTLAKLVGDSKGYKYFTFDDDIQREAAKVDPVGYVAELPDQVVLDEVQRVPEIFTSLKATVDKNRRPGRFLLTGSANVLLVPRLADSLAGRMNILGLHPLSQVERSCGNSDFLSKLFLADFKSGTTGRRLGKELSIRVVDGGYPAALARRESRRRAAWYRDYADSMIQRDVLDIASISKLDALPRLLAMAASQTACLVNISDLAAPFKLSRQTIRDYLTLLTRIFVVDELSPWHNNRLKRLVKTPKLHMGDTGLACALIGLNADLLWQDRATFGRLLETFMYQELKRQASWQDYPVSFSHFRDKDKVEIDFVLELGGKLAGIEVKAAATVTSGDFKGLRKLQKTMKDRFVAGVVLYDGESVVPFGPALYAVPISSIWENGITKNKGPELAS